jgi:hypothetical protein
MGISNWLLGFSITNFRFISQSFDLSAFKFKLHSSLKFQFVKRFFIKLFWIGLTSSMDLCNENVFLYDQIYANFVDFSTHTRNLIKLKYKISTYLFYMLQAIYCNIYFMWRINLHFKFQFIIGSLETIF